MKCCFLNVIVLVIYLQSTCCFTTNYIRLKRAPFSFRDFFKQTSETVLEAAKKVNVEQVKKNLDNIRSRADSLQKIVEDNAEKISKTDWKSPGQAFVENLKDSIVSKTYDGWDNVRYTVEDAGHKLQEHVEKNLDNIRSGADSLQKIVGDNAEKISKTDWKSSGQAFVENLKDSIVSKTYDNLDNIRSRADSLKKIVEDNAEKISKTDWKSPGQAFVENFKDSIVSKTYKNWNSIRRGTNNVGRIIGDTAGKIYEIHWKPEPELDGDLRDSIVSRTYDTSKEDGTPKDPTKCYVPNYPQNGVFVVTGIPDAQPGLQRESLYITFSCNYRYRLTGNSTVSCYSGDWLDAIPQCELFCELREHASVEYYCKIPDSNDTKICDRYIKNYDVVIPECRIPNYYNTSALPNMKCINGDWNYLPKCKPVCGLVTPQGKLLAIGGRAAKQGELPWHIGIYRKNGDPYLQICGGSIVTTTLVISAAHCFWSDADKYLPESMFAVAAGILYRPWNESRHAHAQRSDLKEIMTPKRFRGAETNFQDDIALVFLETPFVYKTFVRPICVDFETHLNNKQLFPGSVGKVAGWGLTSEDGRASPVLKVVNLAYVDVVDCLRDSPSDFREYITSDKFCAGYKNGTALCRGDSGGGLVYAELEENGFHRHYLRGIASTAPKNDHECNSNVYTTFTEIVRHAPFISSHYH